MAKLQNTPQIRNYSYVPNTVVDWNSLPEVVTSAATRNSFLSLLP